MFGPSAIVAPSAMLIALATDVAWGEPPAAWHPVVLMGKFLAWYGRGLPERAASRAFVGGSALWLVGAAGFTGVAWALVRTIDGVLRPDASWVRAAAAAVVYGVLLKPMFAWALLRREVQAVEVALAQGVTAGRARVALISSRDSSRLSGLQVRETAIESLAENLNDSVIAPLLWFAVAGLAGATLYRFANTADAMWGYRGRWEWAGKWAARADDVLSWLPARLTGMALMAPATWFGSRHWLVLRREARRTASPNSGWPMGAMALRLGVQLGKPGMYVLNPSGRCATADDSARATRLAAIAIVLLLPLLLGLVLLMRRT